MKKEDKEKLIGELAFKYIESLDRDATIGFWSKVGTLGALFAFLLSNSYLQLSLSNGIFFAIIVIFIIYIFYSNSQYVKYTDDLYYDIIKSIREGRILNFKIKPWKWYNQYFFYKKRHK